MPRLRNILIFTHPIQILFGLLTYGFGLGLARYLGSTLLPEPQFIGGIIVALLLATSNLLIEYFRPLNEPLWKGESRKERLEIRPILLITSFCLLGIVSILAFSLNRDGYLNTESAIILLLFVILALANGVPPVRIINRGLGEFSTAIQISSLSPALAFLFQFGTFHRILTIYTFPLLLLGLSYLLSLNFPSYADDLKYDRKSLLINLTWQRAIPIHNLLIVLGYFCFAIIPFLGIPLTLVWPALLTLPIAIYQVFTMRNLAEGAKPVWSIIIAASTIIFGLTTYLIALTFWLH